MILVAATAAGVAMTRAWASANAFDMLDRQSALRPYDWASLAYRLALPYLWTWTPAWLVLRLHSPRPRLRRLARQPGMAACVAATLSMGFVVSRALLLSVGVPHAFNRGYSASWWLLHLGAPEVATAVAAAWLILVLAGWWRPESGWVDRLGITLAAGWIAVVLVESFCPLLLP